MIYFKILGIAVALFILLRSVSALFSILAIKRIIRTTFLRIFPVVEMLLWFVYIFWALNLLFEGETFYPLLTGALIIVLVAVFGYYLLRDFFSGIILKAENAFEVGQTIVMPDVSGTIIKLGYRSIEIESNEGEHIKIPYSLLSNRNLIRPDEKGKGTGRMIKLKVSTQYEVTKIQNMFERRILEMPWINSSKSIDIIIKKIDDRNYLAEIHFYALSVEMAMKTEESLQVFVREVFSEN